MSETTPKAPLDVFDSDVMSKTREAIEAYQAIGRASSRKERRAANRIYRQALDERADALADFHRLRTHH